MEGRKPATPTRGAIQANVVKVFRRTGHLPCKLLFQQGVFDSSGYHKLRINSSIACSASLTFAENHGTYQNQRIVFTLQQYQVLIKLKKNARHLTREWYIHESPAGRRTYSTSAAATPALCSRIPTDALPAPRSPSPQPACIADTLPSSPTWQGIAGRKHGQSEGRQQTSPVNSRNRPQAVTSPVAATCSRMSSLDVIFSSRVFGGAVVTMHYFYCRLWARVNAKTTTLEWGGTLTRSRAKEGV